MSRKVRIAVRVFLISAAVLIVAIATVAAWLTFPGTPTSTGSLRFEGFVSLPQGTNRIILTVLDYLTVNGTKLFVTDVSSGGVYRIELRDHTLPRASDISEFESTPGVHGVVIDPVSHLALVTRSGSNTVDVFDPEAMKLIKRLPVADDPDGIFYDPFDKIAYAVNGDAEQATLIDPARQVVIGRIPLGGKPEFAVFDPQSNLMYQNLKDTNTLIAVDIAKRSVAGRWPLHSCESPTGIAIDGVRRQLFIACGRNSTLAVFDIAKHHIVSSLPIGRGPDSVAFDPVLKRIYTTGLSGDLAVIQQDPSGGYRALDSIHLHFGAHTLAVDPATHRLYVGYASLFLQPRIAIFAAIK